MDAGKNLEIEYLRAVAVLMTCFSHLTLLLPFHVLSLNSIYSIYMPWSGVDLFFCISGFVVSKSLVEYLDAHRGNGTFWLAAQCFWIRRFYRLTPSAWLWLTLVILCSIFFNTTNAFSSPYQNLRSAAAIVTMTANLASQYDNILGANLIYWSLALEEQFYLLFPLFLLVTPGRWRWRVLLVLITAQFFVERNIHVAPVASMAFVFRLDAMMWGVLVYFFSKTRQYALFEPTFLKRSHGTAWAINLLMFSLLGTIAAQMIEMPIAVGLIALVSALLVLLASYQHSYVCNIPLFSHTLAWLGARSYAIYLIHVPVYRFCVEGWTRYVAQTGHLLDGTFTLHMLFSAVLLTLVLADLNYRFVEEPLRKRGTAIAARRMAKASVENGPRCLPREAH